MSAAERVVLAGGGTAGHVTPALATADALRRADPGLGIEFVGTARGLEARMVPAAGWTLHPVRAAALAGRNPVQAARVPLVVGAAALSLARRLRATNVVAAAMFGGYVCGPLALAARIAGVPLVIQEQNAVPGLANRLAARWATAVAVGAAAATSRFPFPERVVVTGNPVRAGVAGSDRGALRAEALDAFGLEADRRTLLVFGGSLGARRINTAAIDSAGRWSNAGRLQMLHVTGARDAGEVAAGWAARDLAGLLVRTETFVERMELAYAAADVVVCRGGASTLAELTAVGLPAIIVPLPSAVADEQRANARVLAEAGAALVVDDAGLDGAALVAAGEPLLTDPERTAQMSRAAAALGRPDAADRVAAVLLTAAGRAPASTEGDR